jgi:class 3 adenylate cyclase
MISGGEPVVKRVRESRHVRRTARCQHSLSDVAGSTSMGESSDPEDVRAILGRYYAIARAVIEAQGGTVEKFIG